MAESVWLAARDTKDSDEKHAGAFRDSLLSEFREKLHR